MSPEAAALARRLRDRWDHYGALVADVAAEPAEGLELVRRTRCPLIAKETA